MFPFRANPLQPYSQQLVSEGLVRILRTPGKSSVWVLFSNCVEWGPLSAVASLIAEQTASGHTGFSTGHGWAQSLQFPGFGAQST